MRYDSHELQSTRTDKMQRLGDLANLPFTSLCFICFTLILGLVWICTTLSLWYPFVFAFARAHVFGESWHFKAFIPQLRNHENIG